MLLTVSDSRVTRSEVDTLPSLKEELSRPDCLVLVSRHGPGFRRRELFVPFISDDRGVTLQVCDSPQRIRARAGIIFDARNAGRPQFREALAPHLGQQITHVGVIGLIYPPDSKAFVEPILQALFGPDRPRITPETVAAAAESVKLETQYHLTYASLGPPEAL